MKSQLIHLPINNAAKHTRHIEKQGTLEIRQSFCTTIILVHTCKFMVRYNKEPM